MGDEEVSLVDLKVGQAIILERLENTRHDVESKHKQNRADIHTLRGIIQICVDDIWKLKVKIAGYAAIAGVITAIAVHYVEKLMFGK